MAGRRDGLWGADGVSSSSGARASLFGSASLAQRGGQQQQALLEERDIEAELDGVADRVARLRRVVGAIDEEAKAHSCLVEDLEDVMRKAQAALKETLRKMNRTYASGGGGYHMVWLALFAFFFLLLMYGVARGYRFLKWLF